MPPVFRPAPAAVATTRPRAAVHQRPSGRSRSPRIDPSTITSPTPGSSTQISPGVRGTIGPTPPHNHSPPDLTEARVQISGSEGLVFPTCPISSRIGELSARSDAARSGGCWLRSRPTSSGSRETSRVCPTACHVVPKPSAERVRADPRRLLVVQARAAGVGRRRRHDRDARARDGSPGRPRVQPKRGPGLEVPGRQDHALRVFPGHAGHGARPGHGRLTQRRPAGCRGTAILVAPILRSPVGCSRLEGTDYWFSRKAGAGPTGKPLRRVVAEVRLCRLDPWETSELGARV